MSGFDGSTSPSGREGVELEHSEMRQGPVPAGTSDVDVAADVIGPLEQVVHTVAWLDGVSSS